MKVLYSCEHIGEDTDLSECLVCRNEILTEMFRVYVCGIATKIVYCKPCSDVILNSSK
jgi:hypothetical protein